MRTPALVLLAVLALAGVALSCDDTEEVLPQVSETGTALPTGSSISSGRPSLTPTPTPTRAAEPSKTPSATANWKEYTDPALGFSFRYPPDLVATDLTGPEPKGSFKERVIDVRSPMNTSRGFTISISESNPELLSLNEWAAENVCPPGSASTGVIDAIAMVQCKAEVLDDQSVDAVVAEYDGRFFFISSILAPAEFDQVIKSFKF